MIDSGSESEHTYSSAFSVVECMYNLVQIMMDIGVGMIRPSTLDGIIVFVPRVIRPTYHQCAGRHQPPYLSGATWAGGHGIGSIRVFVLSYTFLVTYAPLRHGCSNIYADS